MAYHKVLLESFLNKYFCSISFVDDTNHVPPNIPSRTDALLSNIYITEHDVKDILQTLKIGKACGDDGITHQMFIYIHESFIFHTIVVSVDFFSVFLVRFSLCSMSTNCIWF
jgi:hypothetical protein